MSFLVYIDDERQESFDSIHDMQAWLLSRIAYWNNFENDTFRLNIYKSDDDEAIKIEVKDDIETGDRFG